MVDDEQVVCIAKNAPIHHSNAKRTFVSGLRWKVLRDSANIHHEHIKCLTTLKTSQCDLKELGHLEKMWAKSVDLRGKVKKYHITTCQIDGVK